MNTKTIPVRIARVILALGTGVTVKTLDTVTIITFGINNGDSYARGVAAMFEGTGYTVHYGINAGVLVVDTPLEMPTA